MYSNAMFRQWITGRSTFAISNLQEMLCMENEATLLVAGKAFEMRELDGWDFKDNEFLLADIQQVIESKKVGGSVFQGLTANHCPDCNF